MKYAAQIAKVKNGFSIAQLDWNAPTKSYIRKTKTGTSFFSADSPAECAKLLYAIEAALNGKLRRNSKR